MVLVDARGLPVADGSLSTTSQESSLVQRFLDVMRTL